MDLNGKLRERERERVGVCTCGGGGRRRDSISWWRISPNWSREHVLDKQGAFENILRRD
jgi:hypothetical protein